MWYQLKGNNKTEEEFYQCSKVLSLMLEEKIEQDCGKWVRSFLDYIKQEGVVKNNKEWYFPNETEASLELILLGVTYRWYTASQKQGTAEQVRYCEVMRMLAQLDASGEFAEEMCRWKVWMRFFISLGAQEWNTLWRDIFCVLLWLEEEGKRELQQFLSPEKKFLSEYQLPEKAKGDDYLLYRDALFYYINMLGAQILNRCYRKAYEKAEQYYIFLPGCMTAGKGCQAEKVADGFGCMACRPECMVNIITKAYEKAGVKVRILYHESEMNQHYVEQEKAIGVIGVSCILNLLSGGFKARRLGYIPQCVILNYPGCEQHWEKQGRIVTALCLEELENIQKK